MCGSITPHPGRSPSPPPLFIFDVPGPHRGPSHHLYVDSPRSDHLWTSHRRPRYHLRQWGPPVARPRQRLRNGQQCATALSTSSPAPARSFGRQPPGECLSTGRRSMWRGRLRSYGRHGHAGPATARRSGPTTLGITHHTGAPGTHIRAGVRRGHGLQSRELEDTGGKLSAQLHSRLETGEGLGAGRQDDAARGEWGLDPTRNSNTKRRIWTVTIKRYIPRRNFLCGGVFGSLPALAGTLLGTELSEQLLPRDRV